MNAENIEKEIKELRQKISEKVKKGQKKIQDYKKLEQELNEGAALITRWKSQIEVLQKVLN